jgi:hypothetical protein
VDAAIDEFRRAAAGLPHYAQIPLYVACACGLAGRAEEARAALAESNRLLPNFTIAKWRENAESDHPDFLAARERWYEVLRKLGMPEA